MATLKENSDSWGSSSIIIRDHRHDKGDGYEETPHKKVSKKETPAKKPGCKANDNGPHVYIWTSSRYKLNVWGGYVDKVQPKYTYRDSPYYESTFHSWNPFKTQEEHIAWLEKREYQICAGCYKTTGKQRMKDDERPDKSWWMWL